MTKNLPFNIEKRETISYMTEDGKRFTSQEKAVEYLEFKIVRDIERVWAFSHPNREIPLNRREAARALATNHALLRLISEIVCSEEKPTH